MQKADKYADLLVGLLWRLVLCPHYLALLATINGDDLTMNMTAEIVAGDGQDGHGDSFNGSWFT